MNCLAGKQLLRKPTHTVVHTSPNTRTCTQIGVKPAERSDWRQVRANETPIYLLWRRGGVCAYVDILVLITCLFINEQRLTGSSSYS